PLHRAPRPRQGPSGTAPSTRTQQYPLDSPGRTPLQGPAPALPAVAHLPALVPEVAEGGRLHEDSASPRGRPVGARRHRCARVLHRRHVRQRKKRGPDVGKTKRGKGTKIMAVADRHGLPVAICTASASPHEVKLVDRTLDASHVPFAPDKLIGDKAYDSDGLDAKLAEKYGTELIAPNRAKRKKTQDARKLPRYRRRWKVERLFAWLQNF